MRIHKKNMVEEYFHSYSKKNKRLKKKMFQYTYYYPAISSSIICQLDQITGPLGVVHGILVTTKLVEAVIRAYNVKLRDRIKVSFHYYYYYYY